jgi:molybdopterin converting factor small subunit
MLQSVGKLWIKVLKLQIRLLRLRSKMPKLHKTSKSQGADLKNATFQSVQNLKQHQIELAKGDRTTILPENL